MKGNTWTIVRKECARFFGDKQLLFTSVILPGVLIYVTYSLMGSGIKSIATDGADEMVAVVVENMPESMAPILTELDSNMVLVERQFDKSDVAELEDKDVNVVLVRFPMAFDSLVAAYEPIGGEPAPNVEIYHNSANNASQRVYYELEAVLDGYENAICNRFNINYEQLDENNEEVRYDMADMDDVLGDIWSKLLPMLIMMLLFSGVMAIAPSSIAGEKERGTIATLLVTPMRRNELALGKVISLSFFALLSGLSSFVGIALSLPKMINPDAAGVELGFNYALQDYVGLLLMIMATVFLMASVLSILSALAKDLKNAGTMVMPLMLVLMFVGLIPMFQSGATEQVGYYLIPFYNSIQVMVGIFAHQMSWLMVGVTAVANVVYSCVAVWGLTRLFNNEKVMFGR